MTFAQAITVIKDVLSHTGTTIDSALYDGVIVKRLAESNTLDTGRSTTNQTHIAITGEQMDIFPYLCADGYFYEGTQLHDADLKKYFVIRVPVTLFESNLNHLGYDGSDFHFENGQLDTSTSVVRSKRSAQPDQLQVSMLDMDGADFVAFRRLMHEGTYFILLKCKKAMKYHAFGVNATPRPEDTDALNNLNSRFFKASTNTAVDADVFNSSTEELVITDPIPDDLTVEQLGIILRQMYDDPTASSQTNAIRMFAIKYAKVMLDKNYTPTAVVQASGINASFDTEVSKGINIYKSIRDNEYGIRFYEEEEPDHDPEQEGPVAVGGINKIFYGAPGCGKSRYVTDLLRDAHVPEENIVRVTFHPEYSNVDFIGQILPTIEKDETDKDVVEYIFNPGSFSLALQKAYNTTDMVYLIVEEINRGNAAAIFGDMFQLLDRERDTARPNFSASEYPVSNPNLQKYLIGKVNSQGIKERLERGVYIPGNLTILATMNSSDQNVFTLDTAFKRRWSFEQISNDIVRDVDHKYKGWYVPGTDKTWEVFLTKLNDRILDYRIHNQTNEDKRLGKYFVTQECLTEQVQNVSDVQEQALAFAYKVLEYVWNDVCKIGREEWFDTEKYKTLEQLIEAFMAPAEGENPLSVFQNITF